MNYVRHLNAFFSLVRCDNRLTSSHVSLYMALFQCWNSNRFQNPFPINRETILQLSKIGSKTTYHKCIRELHQAKYINAQSGISKFRILKISIIPLDNDPGHNTNQPELFTNTSQESKSPNTIVPVPPGPTSFTYPVKSNSICSTCTFFNTPTGTNNGTSPVPILAHTSTDSGTDPVPILAPAGTNSGTDTVPKMGHINKLNSKNNVCVKNTPTHIFLKNKKIQEELNKLARDPNLGPEEPSYEAKSPSPDNFGRGGFRGRPPILAEVLQFFHLQSYPPPEAQKFYLYNQAKSWMLTDRLPITDWQALAHKWMLNVNSQTVSSPSPSGEGFRERENLPHGASPLSMQWRGVGGEVQSLYQTFLSNQNPFKSITPIHFTILDLKLEKTALEEARRHRMNQLTGSNQYSVNQLLQAYESGNDQNEWIQKDQPNLIALAKRFAVFQYFYQCQQSGITKLDIKPDV